ncbi:MAG: hypothetical protein ABI687_12905, partial [Flavitalea sp.]
LDSRNVLLSGMKSNPSSGQKPSEKATSNGSQELPIELSKPEAAKPRQEATPGMMDIVIPLKSTKEKAHLWIPEDYTSEDLDRISKFVDALK